MVDHDVKAKNLKAERVVHVVGLARAEQMEHVRLRQAQRLHDYLVNFVLDSLARQHAELHLDPVQHRLVRPLTSHVIVVFVCVLNEGARLLIDCIVGQVHAKIVQVGWSWALVLNSRETREPILKHIHSQRRYAIN